MARVDLTDLQCPVTEPQMPTKARRVKRGVIESRSTASSAGARPVRPETKHAADVERGSCLETVNTPRCRSADFGCEGAMLRPNALPRGVAGGAGSFLCGRLSSPSTDAANAICQCRH